MAEVTRRHRELALWAVHAVRVAPSGSELERWVETGERGVLHGILIRTAECFANIEAEARIAATQAHAEQGEQPAQKPISIESTCSECGRSKSPIDRCSPDSIDDDGECPYLTIERLRADADRAFVRGFAIAVAQTVRHQVDARDLLRSISATEALLAEAGVEEFDLVELRPALAKIGSKLGVEVAGG